MLVLSRKLMERIQIGESIVVTVLEIRGNRVRIGIDAPRDIGVLRTELQHTDSELPIWLGACSDRIDRVVISSSTNTPSRWLRCRRSAAS
jgi:carbon storage regulator